MKIWKPRSRRKPSTVSVRTRPPTASEASRRRKGMFWEASRVAAAKPDRPAPIMMTPGFWRWRGEGSGGGVGMEICEEEDLDGLRVRRRRWWEVGEEREGLENGRERVRDIWMTLG